MNETPLIAAMRTAGQMSERIARSLLTDYPHTGGAMLADALVEDQTGHSAINDDQRLRDRDGSAESRRQANERKTQRMQIAIRFDRFDREMREAICRALATGNGAALADELVERSTLIADAVIADANRDARVTAVAS